MQYSFAKVYTIWSLNINTINHFQFLTIFAPNVAILPQKWEVFHFPEVFWIFWHFLKQDTNYCIQKVPGLCPLCYDYQLVTRFSIVDSVT